MKNCATVQIYLAVWNDLAKEQRELVSHHVQKCETCASLSTLFQSVTKLITHLPETQPSAQVDRAIEEILANYR